MRDQLDKALALIAEEKIENVRVALHFHFDKDKNYDYYGEHTIYVNVHLADSNLIRSFDVGDIEHKEIEYCRKEHNKVFEEVRKIYSNAIKREYMRR